MSSELPAGWAKRAVSDLLVRDTSAVSVSELHAAGEVWHYSIPAFDEFHAPIKENGANIKSNKTFVSSDSILFSKLNPRIPRVWRIKGLSVGLSVCSTEFWCLGRRSESVDLDYMSLFLSSSVFLGHPSIKPSSSTNSHQRVDRKAFDRFEVCLPPLQEQQKIAEILTSVDNAIQATEAVIEQTKKVKQGLMNRLLYSRSKELGGELGGLPEGWTETTLGHHVDLLSGFAFKSAGYVDDGVRLLRGDNVGQGRLRWRDAKCWPESDVGSYRRYQLQVGDVIIAMDRTWIPAGLKVATIEAEDLPCLLLQRVSRLRAGPFLRQGLLRQLVSSHAFAEYVKAVQTETAVPHISAKQIRDFPVALPPLPEQDRLVEMVYCIDRSQKSSEDSLAGLIRLKSGLMAELLTGRKRVPV